jgi:hypothetical protein
VIYAISRIMIIRFQKVLRKKIGQYHFYPGSKNIYVQLIIRAITRIEKDLRQEYKSTESLLHQTMMLIYITLSETKNSVNTCIKIAYRVLNCNMQ